MPSTNWILAQRSKVINHVRQGHRAATGRVD
jgi:hypothetical protein